MTKAIKNSKLHQTHMLQYQSYKLGLTIVLLCTLSPSYKKWKVLSDNDNS